MNQGDYGNGRFTHVIQNAIRVFDYLADVLALVFSNHLAGFREQSKLLGPFG